MKKAAAPALIATALIVAAAVVLAGSYLGGGNGDGSGVADPEARDRALADAEFDPSGWKTDFAKHEVPLSEFSSGGPPRDGIPPIDRPKFVPLAEGDNFLAAREPVIAVAIGDEARAYPVQILVWHEIVNDTLAGRPIVITYCPLCNSAVVADRRVDGRTLTFGTTGNLRKSNLVMWDRQTESWWQQIGGRAVVGELTGKELEQIPAQTLSWEDFKERYPDGDVLSRDTGFKRDYGSNPYVGYDEPGSQPSIGGGQSDDDRLPPKERVSTVTIGDETVVVPYGDLVKRPVAETEVSGRPIVVFYKSGVISPLDAQAITRSRDVGTTGVLDRRLGSRTLTFESRGKRYADRQTGSVWDITGRATAGPLKGRRLKPVSHDDEFWFAIAAFYPKAKIVRPQGKH